MSMDDVSGIRCTRCGCPHLLAVYKRQVIRKVKRVRECRNCGKRVVTFEVVSADIRAKKRSTVLD